MPLLIAAASLSFKFMSADKSTIQKKIDNLCRYIFLTEDGRPKSAAMLYSFCLAIIFTVVYFVSYFVLLGPIENLLVNSPVFIRNCSEYVIPAIVGSIPCVSLFFVMRRNRQYVPLTYNWMVFFTLLGLVGIFMNCSLDDYWNDFALFMTILGIPAVLSVGIGFAASHLLYANYQKKEQQKIAAKRRPSYYNS